MAHLTFKQLNTDEDGCLIGELKLGDYHESFRCSIEPWQIVDYLKHWIAQIEKTLSDDNPIYLISSWQPVPGKENLSGSMWILYPVNHEQYALQCHLILNSQSFQDVSKPDADNITILERSSVSDCGHQVSEWSISRAELIELLEQLKVTLRQYANY